MSSNIRRLSVSLLAVLAVVSAAPAHATAVDVPTSADPGILSRSLSGQIRNDAAPREMIRMTPEREQAASPEEQQKIFTLSSVTVAGSTVFTKAEIDTAIAAYIGKQTSFADLNAIAQVLTAKYRNAGYIFSRVIVPPQKVTDGVVRMTAIEGRITDVRLTGNYQDTNGLIAAYADKIKTEGPATNEQIERYLLLINDLPGVTARALMAPSQTPGGGELTIDVEQKQVEGALSVDNRGTRYIGPYRGTAIVAANSLFDVHDRTTVRVITAAETSELGFGEVTHEEQLGTEGTRLKARYSITRTRPGNNLHIYEIKGDSDTFDLEAMHPLFRSRTTNLNLLGGFTSLGSETAVLKTRIAQDRVRSVRVGAHYDLTDSWSGINQFETSLIKGLKIFDATKDGFGRSRSNGDHDFVRATFSATRVQDLGHNFSVQVSGSGQYSPKPLLASEEFSLGGTEFGRAYDAGEITGDQGIAGMAELRYGQNLDDPYVQAYQAYTYYDSGRVWNVDPVVGESKSAVLSSVGVGVRFNFAYDMSGSAEFDQPLTRKVGADDDKGSRVFFSLLKRF